MQQTKTENYKFFINFFCARPEVKNSTSARPKRFGRVFRPEVNIKQLKNAHKWAFNENNSTRSGALDLDQKWRGNTSPPPLRGKLLGDFRHDRREGGPQSNGFGDPLTLCPYPCLYLCRGLFRGRFLLLFVYLYLCQSLSVGLNTYQVYRAFLCRADVLS